MFGHGLYVLASFPVFFLSAWLVATFWMPRFLHEERISLYGLLERRFDYRVRVLASGLFLFRRFFWMATALYATARIMGVLTGVPLPVAVLVGGVVGILLGHGAALLVEGFRHETEFHQLIHADLDRRTLDHAMSIQSEQGVLWLTLEDPDEELWLTEYLPAGVDAGRLTALYGQKGAGDEVL